MRSEIRSVKFSIVICVSSPIRFTNDMIRAMNSAMRPAVFMSLPLIPSYGTVPPGGLTRSSSPGTAIPIINRFKAESHVPKLMLESIPDFLDRRSAVRP